MSALAAKGGVRMAQAALTVVAKEDPTVYVVQACWWIKNNPKSFKKLKRIVDAEVEAGNPRLQRSRVYTYAQEEDVKIESGELDGITRNHNIWPIISRYMAMLEPSRAKTLHFRGAGCDGSDIDMIAIWRSIVNAGTTFKAESWREAKELCNMRDVTAL